MCITLLLLSPEYAASQQAEATSTPEEAAPQSGKRRKPTTCKACGEVGHAKASDTCSLKGKKVPTALGTLYAK